MIPVARLGKAGTEIHTKRLSKDHRAHKCWRKAWTQADRLQGPTHLKVPLVPTHDLSLHPHLMFFPLLNLSSPALQTGLHQILRVTQKHSEITAQGESKVQA